jgi:hypothetical protein
MLQIYVSSVLFIIWNRFSAITANVPWAGAVAVLEPRPYTPKPNIAKRYELSACTYPPLSLA